jgi:predicted signal transduction protein with EAL and GGDEF domain
MSAGLDPLGADPALLRRIRTFNLCTLMLIAVAFPLVALTLAVGRPWTTGLAVVLIAASSANMVLLRRTRRPELSGHLSVALLFAFLVGEAASGGGFHHPDLAWLYVVPVVAATLTGARGCVVWVALSALGVLGLWLLALSGVDLSVPRAFADQPILDLASHVAALVSLGVLSAGFMAAQRQLEVQLEARSRDHHRDAICLRLLHEAAAASNESRSVEEAFQTSLELICQALDWPIAQLYSTSSEERSVLRASPIRFVVCETKLAAFGDRYRSAERADPADLAYRALHAGRSLWIEDVRREPGLPHAELARTAGLGAAVLIPVRVGDSVTAVVEFFAQEPLARNSRLLEYLEQIAAQVGHAAQRALAREQMRSLVFFDALTGLPNRRFFQERLDVALESASRSNTRLALFFLDLDGFKVVNDTLGHVAGDELLRLVSSRLARIVRLGDCVARGGDSTGDSTLDEGALSRLGGDEFTVLLPGIVSRGAAAKVGRRLLRAFREPFWVGGREIFSGVSIGVALYPEDGSDTTTLLRSADIAMYDAKERGRNNFKFFDTLHGSRGTRRLALESRLSRAVENEEFELYYQPIHDVRHGHVVGAEALLRWNDSELGAVSPVEFIPVAERCGQIGALGSWVVLTAVRQAAAWIEAGLRPIRVSVNVSGYQVRHPRIVPAIRDALAQNRLGGSRLEFELTESTIIQDDDVTNEILRELSSLGIGLALDDFGTGYSSLSYLRRLPIGRLKIDRSFISEVPASRDGCALVSAVIAMAHRLRIQVAAEGVENEAQLEFLRKHECDEAQGFLFSPAVPAADLARMLEGEGGVAGGGDLREAPLSGVELRRRAVPRGSRAGPGRRPCGCRACS